MTVEKIRFLATKRETEIETVYNDFSELAGKLEKEIEALRFITPKCGHTFKVCIDRNCAETGSTYMTFRLEFDNYDVSEECEHCAQTQSDIGIVIVRISDHDPSTFRIIYLNPTAFVSRSESNCDEKNVVSEIKARFARQNAG